MVKGIKRFGFIAAVKMQTVFIVSPQSPDRLRERSGVWTETLSAQRERKAQDHILYMCVDVDRNVV